MSAEIQKVQIDDYHFIGKNNPYEGDGSEQPIALVKVARQIAAAINNVSAQNPKLLVRGVQSGKYVGTKKQLLEKIPQEGREFANKGEPNTIYAAPYEGECTLLHILEGFHKYKPKCEERPQYPVDIWLLFDAGAYSNIEYLHPRHNVVARDKWKRGQPDKSGLVKIIELDNPSKPIA